jgi:hypothetical protein
MDSGWRNLEGAANDYLERQKSVASKADCIEGADQPQTSDIRDALPQFAMMISLQRTSFEPIVNAPKKLCNFPIIRRGRAVVANIGRKC